MGKIVKNGVTYSGSSDNADNVKYNNNVSNLDATNVQEAIDKLDESVDILNSNLTQVQTQIVPTASIEIGETASKAYSVGDFLVKDGILYKVTKSIVKDDALTVGTNIVITTVCGELSEKSNSTNYKLIWTNPNDESNFDAQTITLNETGTVFLIDIAIDNTINYIGRSHLIAPVMPIGTGPICLFGARTADSNTGKRDVKITSTQTQTMFEFSRGYPANNWMRPHAIYKVK